MAETIAGSAGNLDQRRGTQQAGFSFIELPQGPIPIDNVSGGMVVGIPKSELPDDSFSLVRNARTREEWVGRRPGTEIFGGTKPDSLPVLKLVTFITSFGNVYLIRITRAGVHIHSTSGWTAFTPSAFDVVDYDHRVTLAQLLGFLVIANGGTMTYLDLENGLHIAIPDAPKAKYITAFAERVIAAHILDPVGGIGPTKIRWSKNADFTDWTDISAGEENLVQSPSDFSDEITGLFGLERELVILRRRSIWHAERLPFAQAPFRFTAVIAGFGCDLPYTAVQGEGVIFYADQRTKGVYAYAPGSRPQRISLAIDRELYKDLQNLEWAEGTYDPYEQEYHLGLSIGAGKRWITRVWVFSVKNSSWSYDDSPEVSTVGVVSTPGTFVAIDDLIGTIDAQVGTIDELGGEVPLITPVLFKGVATGEVLKQSYDSEHDWNHEALTPGFEFELISQDLGSPIHRRTMIDMTLKGKTSIDAAYTLDQRNESEVWRNTKTGTMEPTDVSLRLPKTALTGRDILWRLRSTNGFIRLHGWWVRIHEKGYQR